MKQSSDRTNSCCSCCCGRCPHLDCVLRGRSIGVESLEDAYEKRKNFAAGTVVGAVATAAEMIATVALGE